MSIELAEALAATKNRGVRVLTDQEKATASGTAIRILCEKRVEVRSLGVSERRLMHHTLAVFDDRDVVDKFTRELQRLWREAKD